MDEDDAWVDELEKTPQFIVSQMRPGHVISDGDVKALGALLSELDRKENHDIDTFHEGRLAGLREIGGEDLVTAVQMEDERRIAEHVRKTMDRIFPKAQRTPH